MQPTSLVALLTLLLLAAAAAQPGSKTDQESFPAKFLQIFTTAEKVGDNGDKTDEKKLVGEAKRNIAGDAIMRSLRSSSALPSTIGLGVQHNAMLRYILRVQCALHRSKHFLQLLLLRGLRSSSPQLGISQESLMRSLRSGETPAIYMIDLPENAMMRSLRSEEETGISDAAMMRSLRSFKTGNVADQALMRSLRSQDLNIARDALLRSLRQDTTDISQKAMMRSLRSYQPNNINDAAMMRALRSYKPNIANDAMMRSLRSYDKNIKEEAMMRSLRSSLPTRLATRDPLKEGIMRGL